MQLRTSISTSRGTQGIAEQKMSKWGVCPSWDATCDYVSLGVTEHVIHKTIFFLHPYDVYAIMAKLPGKILVVSPGSIRSAMGRLVPLFWAWIKVSSLPWPGSKWSSHGCGPSAPPSAELSRYPIYRDSKINDYTRRMLLTCLTSHRI